MEATPEQIRTAKIAADRLRGIMHNHPKIQYLRLDRREAEALAAVLAPR